MLMNNAKMLAYQSKIAYTKYCKKVASKKRIILKNNFSTTYTWQKLRPQKRRNVV